MTTSVPVEDSYLSTDEREMQAYLNRMHLQGGVGEELTEEDYETFKAGTS